MICGQKDVVDEHKDALGDIGLTIPARGENRKT